MTLDTTAAATSTGAASPASASAPASTPSGTTSTTPPSSTTGTPAAAATSTPPPAQKYEYAEDRSKYLSPEQVNRILQQRLREATEPLTQKIHALAGVTPPDPAAGERAELAKALGEIHPALGKILSLDDRKLDQLLGFIDHIPAVTATIDQYWNRNTQSTLDAVVSAFATKGLKVSLDDADDAEVVRGALVNWVRADRSGRREARFEGNDPKLLDEFVTYFHGRFGAPGSVASTTTAARETDTIRRTLPQPGARTSVTPTTDASTTPPKPSEGGRAAIRALHSRARQAYLDKVGARS